MSRTTRFNETFDQPAVARGPMMLAAAALLIAASAVACGVKHEKQANDSAITSVGGAVVTPAESPDASPPVLAPDRSVPQNVSFATAESAYTRRDYKRATDMFAVYVQRRPDNAWGQYMLGLSAWKSGDLPTAHTAFERALEIDPAHVKSLLNLSRVLLEQDSASAALDRVSRALAIDSTSGEVHRMMGRVRTALGQPDSAIASYRLALSQDPTDVWSMNNMALLLIQQGKYDEALPALARAVQLRGDAPVFQNNLGIVLEREGHYSAAADAYRAALDADSTYGKAAVSLARVEGLFENPSLEPVELTTLAESFDRQVQSWRDSGTVPVAVTARKPEP